MQFPKKWPETDSKKQSAITQHLPARRKQIPEKRAKINSNSNVKDDQVHKVTRHPLIDKNIKEGESADDTKVNTEDRKKLDALKAFDLNLKYGPCVGLSRMTRWERAERLGLDPPNEIKSLIQNGGLKKRIGMLRVERCLWYDILEMPQ